MASRAQGLLDKFVNSIGDLLNDITALEVNTMIVTQITAAKFNAWEAYQEIYSICDSDYFVVKRIPTELQTRYKNLFEGLEREYFYILVDPGSGLYNPNDERIRRYRERIELLKRKQGQNVESDPKYKELVRPILPDPTVLESTTLLELQRLLNNSKFLRDLLKVFELKAALDSSDATSESIDIIYAQTVMQLDGDIITRYHEKLFDREDIKDLVLKTHNEGVISGEKQWRGLLDFMVDLVKSTTSRGLFNGR
jgi:hypothetical protein